MLCITHELYFTGQTVLSLQERSEEIKQETTRQSAGYHINYVSELGRLKKGGDIKLNINS